MSRVKLNKEEKELYFKDHHTNTSTIAVASYIRLETKSCRILSLTYGTKYDMTYFPA